MKLIEFKKLSPQARRDLSLIIGVLDGNPVLVGRKKQDQTWSLYKNVGSASLKKENLKKLGKVSSFDDLLAFMQDKGLKAFCPKKESDADQDMAVLQGSIPPVERRRHYRKRVDLPGGCHISRTERFSEVQILDVSFRGLKFSISDPDEVQVGDVLYMTFTLDNSKKSVIKRKVLVRHTNQETIGTEFINPPEYDKDLGFYLL